MKNNKRTTRGKMIGTVVIEFHLRHPRIPATTTVALHPYICIIFLLAYSTTWSAKYYGHAETDSPSEESNIYDINFCGQKRKWLWEDESKKKRSNSQTHCDDCGVTKTMSSSQVKLSVMYFKSSHPPPPSAMNFQRPINPQSPKQSTCFSMCTKITTC